MSEKIYALLLRLFPAHFRERYGQESLQLFRDRSRDERGLFGALRLWLDLLSDLVISIPRHHRRPRPLLTPASARSSDGVPSFCLLNDESPGAGVLLLGAAISLALAFASPVILRAVKPASTFLQSVAFGSPPQASPDHGVPETASLVASDRKHLVDAVIENLEKRYVDPAAGRKIADALRAQQKDGAYKATGTDEALAALLTRQMRDVSHDPHLEAIYSPAILPVQRAAPSPDSLARYREAMRQANCTFEKVEVLPRKIGYLKLNSFPRPSVCEATAVSAMQSLNQAGAIIIDLRENHGGDPEMVALLAAYFFDHPEYLYNPRENTSERSWTKSPVPGNRLADKPLYLLTSATTASAAEHFSYNLKMLKRATLVGETTRGATHSAVFYRIDDHFGVAIPEVKPINPFSNKDWESTGIEPDIRVKAEDSLETAKKLALLKLAK